MASDAAGEGSAYRIIDDWLERVSRLSAICYARMLDVIKRPRMRAEAIAFYSTKYPLSRNSHLRMIDRNATLLSLDT